MLYQILKNVQHKNLFPRAKCEFSSVQSECVYARKREQGAASRNKKMIDIKFVPTSEMRVSLRTEECAERTWEREQGAASRS
mgnify:CR=1 FL=1